MKTRYLTKSRFKLGMECPTKLFYAGKKEYANEQLDDPFLEALAEGGIQVGELAKAYYPGGHKVASLDYHAALKETQELLMQENCIIYEAAINYENLFIRVDILVKEGNAIKIIEVKSKSAALLKHTLTDETIHPLFQYEKGKKKGEIRNPWKPYVYDISFQNYVAEHALPEYKISPYLMLIDKQAICPTNGLNQKFKLRKDGKSHRYSVLTEELSKEDLSVQLVVPIDMKNLCHQVIYENTYPFEGTMIPFPELIKNFAAHYEADHRMEAAISSKCKHCEFKASEAQLQEGLKSGYH
ncbi:hypothetical protein ACLIBH_05415 [Virgibacillus sp. W0430]|uniref:hypothetical protein n=1 Tax=Virgibacillus sp. W0430 TaxID=3391580 RepID=UPI003F4505CF